MGFLEYFLTGVGLAMDAFAVSICKGLEQKKFKVLNMIIIAFLFGFFQFGMPIIAYFCCRGIVDYIESFDHWIAFVLLSFIGIKMIIECLMEYKKEKSKTNLENQNQVKEVENVEKEETKLLDTKEEKTKEKLNIKELFVLAIATSIDALVVGITLALTNANIFLASGVICIVTFVICCCGVLIGSFFGAKFKTSAEIVGGVILILIGLKILLEHLGLLVF